MSFWQTLKNPISVLAPMYDVTDVVFREIVNQCAAPDVFFTEFVNCDAYFSGGYKVAKQKLLLSIPSNDETGGKHETKTSTPTEEKKPTKRNPSVPITVAQIWGTNPDTHYKMAQELVKLGFDGIDINMGCPQRLEMKIGACAALIDNHTLAKELIDATKQGVAKESVVTEQDVTKQGTATQGTTHFPISVKTRTGIKSHKTTEWISFLLDQDLDAITLHARTVAQMSKVSAQWEQIKIAVELRNKTHRNIKCSSDTPGNNAKQNYTAIIGNGDIKDAAHGQLLTKKVGCDGYMIGRGIFNNPWAFSLEPVKITKEKLINLCNQHLDLYHKTYKSSKNYNIMKKFFKVYIRGFEGASALRSKLMKTNSVDEALSILNRL